MIREWYDIRVEGINPHTFARRLNERDSPFYELRVNNAFVEKHASSLTLEAGGIIRAALLCEDICQFTPKQKAFLNKPFVMEIWHVNTMRKVEL